MTTPHSSPTDTQPTHDFVLNDGTNVYGFQFSGNPQTGYQESPLSSGSKIFKIIQNSFLGGRGKKDYQADNTGFINSQNAWTMVDQAIFPSLLTRYAKGIRGADDVGVNDVGTNLLGNYFIPVTQTALACKFVASSAYSAANIYLWLWWKHLPTGATPTGNIMVELWSDSAGAPNTLLQSCAAITPSAREFIAPTFYKVALPAQALVAGTTYWIKVYPSAIDATQTWQVGWVNSGTTGYHYNGAAWVQSGSMIFRITDADIARTFYPFYLWGAYHIVSANEDASAPVMFVNGDLAKAAVGLCASTTIGTTGKTWGTTKWIGARVRITEGKGVGQSRQIASHATDTLTISTPWTIIPDGSSVYCIYATDWWTQITGHGLTNVTNPPVVSKNFVWFPQGKFAYDRRMTFTAGAYSFATDGSNMNNIILGIHTMANGNKKVIGVKSDDYDFRFADIPSTFGDLSWGGNKGIGEYGYKPTGYINYQGTGYMFKENTVFKVVNGVLSEFVFGGMSDTPFSSNGASLAVQNLWLYFTRANSVVQLQGDNAADIENFKVGYEPLAQNMRGPGGVCAAEGWLFRWIDAGLSGYSSILAWNGFGWHSVFSSTTIGIRITNLFWQPCPEYMSRLWIIIGGDLIYQEFPMYSSDPTKDTNCKFMSSFDFTTATFNLGDKDFYKCFNTLLLSNRASAGNGGIALFYQSDDSIGGATWNPILDGYANNQGRLFSITQDARSLLAVIGISSLKQIRFRIVMYGTSCNNPFVLESISLQGSEIEPLKYQWAMTCAVESDGEDLQGNADVSPDVLQLALQNWANTRAQLLTSSTKLSLHGKYVLVEPPTVRMQSIDTEDGSSKWKGTLWFTLRET
jgi:hypothetical protein